MNFDESVKYLYGLGNEVLAMKLGLENIGKLLSALGDPQKHYLNVQIAGTNGKGSTVAFLESICLEAGIKTAATTSPHLISVTERVRIDGKEIGEEDFARHASIVRETSEKLVESGVLETVPTYFEQVTAIALNAFAEAKVELAILETGLGGRFDATTAANAEVVGITSIDYDHQRILGNTLAEIAAEKAAIIREHTKVVVAPQKAEALEIILKQCRAKGVKPVLVSADFIIKKTSHKKGKSAISVNFSTENDVYHDLNLGLAGRHQAVNALTAVNLAEYLREFGCRIEKENIWNGLQNTRHKGRLEFYDGILFDGAHNVAGAQALRDYLKEFQGLDLIAMIFGTMKDKEIDEIAEILFPVAENLILTEPDNPRVKSVGELKEIASKYIKADKIFSVPDVADAINSARRIAGDYPASKRHLILVTGSLYLVGEAQKILKETNPNS